MYVLLQEQHCVQEKVRKGGGRPTCFHSHPPPRYSHTHGFKTPTPHYLFFIFLPTLATFIIPYQKRANAGSDMISEYKARLATTVVARKHSLCLTCGTAETHALPAVQRLRLRLWMRLPSTPSSFSLSRMHFASQRSFFFNRRFNAGI